MIPLLLAAAFTFDPDALAWPAPSDDGTRYLLLEGRRDLPGEAFSYAFRLPAGVWDRPHCHSQTARIFVARGALRLGWTGAGDRAATERLPAGSYAVVPAGVLHFEGADVDTIIIGTATGQWSTFYPDGGGSAGTLGGGPLTCRSR